MTRSRLLALLLFMFAAALPALAQLPGRVPPSGAALPWQLTVGALVAALLIVLAIVGLVWQLRNAERRLSAALKYQDRDAAEREKRHQADLQHWKTELRADVESLRAALAQLPADTDRLLAPRLSKQAQTFAPSQTRPSSAAFDVRDDLRAEDGLAQLLLAANRIVQESSTTLEKFRERMAGVSKAVEPYGPTVDAPVAFIVEHGGSSYAVPNVVKPTRFPNDWFNRADFGVNDEIRRVVSLPKLRRRAGGYDLVERGVFER